jgi:DNA-binding IclR family transcriptional regulator
MEFGKTTLKIISAIYFFGLKTSNIPMLAEKLGINTRTLQNRLSLLKKEGFIEKVAGEYRLTSYGLYIVEEDFRIRDDRIDELSESIRSLAWKLSRLEENYLK